jgi:hypothetical protein
MANSKSKKDQFLFSFTLSDEIKPRENGVEGVLLVPHIEINQKAVESQTIDALMLVESAFASGEYHIYNCRCGEPPCAGLDDGIIVLHHNQFVEWKIPVPLAIPAEAGKTDGRLYRSLNVGTLSDYRRAILAGVEQGAKLVANSKCPVFLLPMWASIPRLIERASELKQFLPDRIMTTTRKTKERTQKAPNQEPFPYKDDLTIYHAKEEFEGTCYVEILPSKFSGKHFNKGSIFINDEVFGLFQWAFKRYIPAYDPWGDFNVSSVKMKKLASDLGAFKKMILEGRTMGDIKTFCRMATPGLEIQLERTLQHQRDELVASTHKIVQWILEQANKTRHFAVLGI